MTNAMRCAWAAVAAAGLAVFVAGCGEDSGGSGIKSPQDLTLGFREGLARVTGVDQQYDIYSIDPTSGPLAGLNPVLLTGVFQPNAEGFYTVYFGANVAPYDTNFAQPMTGTEIRVIAPAGAAPALVSVILRDNASQLDAAALYYSYEYLDSFAITDAIPDAGPIAGGQQVTILGRFPIAAPIATIAEAYAAYQPYFGGVAGGFDASFNPIITTEAMYVLTPAHAPGVVNVSVSTVEANPRFRVLVNGYEYLAPLDVIDVVPGQGWIFGFEQVTIEGTFPVTTAFSNSITAITAADYYYVQFGNRLATFDPFVPFPVITSTRMYVLSPPGEDVGFVDVSVGGLDATGNVIALDALAQAYRYYAMYLLRAVPDQGPLSGGTEVRLEGIFPGTSAINDIYAVDAIYSAYFAYNLAPFVGPPLQPTPSPVFFPSQIDTINQTYTIGYMYVTAPPGPAPGFVDVRVEDDTGRDLTTICPDCYLYLDDRDGIARWDDADVFPSPVGKLLAGELLVRIVGIGTIDQSNPTATGPAFIVPQGGDPRNVDHRILLRQTSYVENGQSFTWEGTNIAPIERIMNEGDTDELLVDGHAAVYLDVEDDEIFGDSLDPSDSGVIQIDAQEGRHFIIDTIPPRLLTYVGNTLRGDDLVSSDVPTGDYLTNTTNIPPSPAHPYPLPNATQHASVNVDGPFDGNTLVRPVPPNESRVAQMFFNVASLSNNFPVENLQFVMDNVVFEDIDIYTMLGETRIASRDTDFFTGSMERQQAGFELGLNAVLTDLVRDEAFINDPRILVSGQFQSSPFSLSEITGIDVQYTIPAGAPLTGDATLGAPIAPSLTRTPAQMLAVFTIGDPLDLATGVDVDDAGPISLIPIVFKAVDRAGDYNPRGDVNVPRKKLWTINDTTSQGYVPGQQPDIGPLNVWWLRTTGTRVVSTVPSSGDTRDPSFSWEPTLSPIPPGEIDGDGVERLYSYALYWTGPNRALSREEQRDGVYAQILPWSDWGTTSELTASQIGDRLDALSISDADQEGVWYLLVVMSVDEAGNVEVWPTTQLDILPANATGTADSPSRIEQVFETGDEERNWERWYVPRLSETIDTIVEPFFWHDSTVSGNFGTADPGENTFGNAEVIPYPTLALFNPLQNVMAQRVMAQFRVTLVTDDSDATINWSITENGSDLGTVTGVQQNPDGSFIVNVFIPDPASTLYLGSANRQPTYYTFHAQTVTSGANPVADSSPATVQFVVVNNVADFIRDRDETQPIRESDVN